MADKKEIKQKLDELLKKSEQFQKDIKDLNNVILYSGILDEKVETQEDPVLPVIPKVVPESPIKVVLKEDLPKEEVKPVIVPISELPKAEVNIPVNQKVEFDFIKEKPKVVAAPKVILAPPKEKRKSFFERNPDLEKFIGERLITFIGIAVLFTGIAFFVKYAIDKDWINETGRSLIGILSGAVLIGIAHRLRKSFRTFSSVLIGGGIAVEYFTITYSHHVYNMFPNQISALLVLVAITIFTVMLSVLYNRQELAIIGIIGGFLTPLMISDGSGNILSLGSYILILNLGMLALAYFKQWKALNYISYGFTVLLFGTALSIEFSNKVNPDYSVALIFSSIFYLVFFLMNIVNNLKDGIKFGAGEIIVLLSNTMIYYCAGYFILNHLGEKSYHGIFTIAVALFNFVFAYLLYKRQNIDKNLIYLLIGLVITFISLAGPVQLDGNNITLFWSAEAVLLLWLYHRSKIILLAYASAGVNLLMLGSLILANWANSNSGIQYFTMNERISIDQPFMSNRFFITSLFALLSLMATHFLLTKHTLPEIFAGLKTHAYKRFIGLTILVISYFTFYVEFYTQMEIKSFLFIEKTVCLATYTAFFTLTLILIIQFRKFDHLKVIAQIMSAIILLGYLLYFNTIVSYVRNEYLVTNGTGYGIYLLHYLLTAIIIAIAVYLFIEIKKLKALEILLSPYLWFISILGVFIVSAEMDHLIISLNYSTESSIGIYRSISGNIAYPIAWGICSFILIVIGMRKQIRQLRIISLSLFALTIIKLIWLGINGQSEAGKIIAFISSGVVLMVVAFMYQKLKKLIIEEDQTAKTN